MNNGTTKPKLLVFLGAGASIELGVPGTKQLTDAVWRVLQGESNPPGTNPCDRTVRPFDSSQVLDFKCLLECFYGEKLNFEHVFHALEALHGVLETRFSDYQGRCRVVESAFFECLHPVIRTLNFSSSFPEIPWSWPGGFQDLVRWTVLGLVRDSCREIAAKPAFVYAQHLYQQLAERFDLIFVTTNYDDTVEQFMGFGPREQGFSRMEDGRAFYFDSYGSVPTLMHLHGSICFAYSNAGGHGCDSIHNQQFEDLSCYENPEAAFECTVSHSVGSSQSGRNTVIGPMITGMQKTDKIIAEPYMSYYRHFQNSLVEVPRVLIIGYGFGDSHINSVLSRIKAFHGDDRRIAVVDYWNKNNWIPLDTSVPADKIDKCDFIRPGFMNIARIWSEGVSILNNKDYQSSFSPEGPASNKLKVFCGGLLDVSQNHSGELIEFFDE